MSGSAKKRREKARRKGRSERQCRRAFETWMTSKRVADEKRAKFDAAFPGLRVQFGEGSESLWMLESFASRREPEPPCGIVMLDGRQLPTDILAISRRL